MRAIATHVAKDRVQNLFGALPTPPPTLRFHVHSRGRFLDDLSRLIAPSWSSCTPGSVTLRHLRPGQTRFQMPGVLYRWETRLIVPRRTPGSRLSRRRGGLPEPRLVHERKLGAGAMRVASVRDVRSIRASGLALWGVRNFCRGHVFVLAHVIGGVRGRRFVSRGSLGVFATSSACDDSTGRW
jgi:hypothetical protein